MIPLEEFQKHFHVDIVSEDYYNNIDLNDKGERVIGKQIEQENIDDTVEPINPYNATPPNYYVQFVATAQKGNVFKVAMEYIKDGEEYIKLENGIAWKKHENLNKIFIILTDLKAKLTEEELKTYDPNYHDNMKKLLFGKNKQIEKKVEINQISTNQQKPIMEQDNKQQNNISSMASMIYSSSKKVETTFEDLQLSLKMPTKLFMNNAKDMYDENICAELISQIFNDIDLVTLKEAIKKKIVDYYNNEQ